MFNDITGGQIVFALATRMLPMTEPERELFWIETHDGYVAACRKCGFDEADIQRHARKMMLLTAALVARMQDSGGAVGHA